MSNSLAIAAVTATLRDLLGQVSEPLAVDPDPDPDLTDAICTARPPDRARQDENENQINIFLYQTAHNPALRNMDLPYQVRPGETAMPPVALTLYYLVTAYGRNYDEVLSHRLLGRAMSILNDGAVLLPGAIAAALGKGSNLATQVERVRLTPHPIASEELSKLWAVFQTPYRISATYEASVVLIDSSRRAKAPPPVLRRGIGAQGDLAPPFPTLTSVSLPFDAQPAARLPSPAPPSAMASDQVRVAGHQLEGTSVAIELSRPLLPLPTVRSPLPGSTDKSVVFDLPGDQTIMPAGLYAVTARVSPSADPAQDRTTNALPLAVAPRIRQISTAARLPSGEVPVSVLVSPQVWPEQRAALLVGNVEVVAEAHATKTDTLDFLVPNPAGTHMARLRVDGVDSLVIDYAADPPVFDPLQVVVLP